MQMLLLQSSGEMLSEENFNGNIDRIEQDASQIDFNICTVCFGALFYIYFSFVSVYLM